MNSPVVLLEAREIAARMAKRCPYFMLTPRMLIMIMLRNEKKKHMLSVGMPWEEEW